MEKSYHLRKGLILIQKISAYAAELNACNFQGDFTCDLGQRQVHSSDNSIYRRVPLAVAYPKNTTDLQLLVQLSCKYKIPLTPQGGSTATVGQSLTNAILVDVQRYLNKILDFDPKNSRLTVEAGCSLQAVQRYLSKYGFYFPVEISPADRCSIGGMVATNAVGVAGACFGRMSANISAVSVVMSDALVFDTHAKNSAWLEKLSQEYHLSDAVKQELKNRARALPRNIGGYDLHSYIINNNAAKLFCGAEGTLGIVTSISLNIKRKSATSLILLQHSEIDLALRAAVEFQGAVAIELLDHQICQVIREQNPEFDLANLGAQEVMIFLEHASPELFLSSISKSWQVRVYHRELEIKKLWQFRAKAVGYISKYQDHYGRRPLALIEDTAVPKTNLPNYIKELRNILERRGIFYGMYGHVDSGCIHVRPALNPSLDRSLMLELVNEVRALCLAHAGVFWGEHGIGYRSEFAKEFWGDAVQHSMQNLKDICDPDYLFNPGKLFGANLVKFSQDWHIGPKVKSAAWLDCNGQAACLGDSSAIMCPSYRATGDKAYSPKGRALMLGYWHHGKGASSLKASLDKCLGCHACVTECPLAVNIPQAKADYLSWYYKNHRRSLSSLFFAKFERFWVLYANIKYSLHSYQSEEAPEVLIFTDVWSYCLSPNVLASLLKILQHMQVTCKVLPPICVGQSAYNEGDMSEMMHVLNNAKKLLLHSDKPILVLEPSVFSFLNTVWPKYSDMPAWHKNLEDIGVWLANKGVVVNIQEPLKVLGHCTELSLQPESISAWQRIFQSKLNHIQPGCCGMAGTFGLKFTNRKISRKLFANWQENLQKSEIALATGCSCRLQAMRYRYKLRHPLEVLALNKEYIGERS